MASTNYTVKHGEHGLWYVFQTLAGMEPAVYCSAPSEDAARRIAAALSAYREPVKLSEAVDAAREALRKIGEQP